MKAPKVETKVKPKCQVAIGKSSSPERFFFDISVPPLRTRAAVKGDAQSFVNFQAAVMPLAENRLGIGAFGKKGKKTLESLVKLLEKRYKVSSEILRGDLTFPELNKYGQLIQSAQKEPQTAPPIRDIREFEAYPGVEESLGVPPEAARGEVKGKAPEPITPLEQTQDFWLAMKQLRGLRGYSRIYSP